MLLVRSSCLRAFAPAPPSTLLRPAISASVPNSRTPERRSHHTPTRSRQRQPSAPIASRRHASTSPASDTTTASPTTSTSTSPQAPSNAAATLNWNEFLRLRRIRRFYNLGGSVLTALVGVGAGGSIFANYDVMGYGQSITGLDPFIIMGAFGVVSAGSGWLMGPLLGSSVWGLVYRRFGGQMRVKEKDFFERIRKYRVDPTVSSLQNPVPDYYGEKITSVAGYRRWLKDQRAFNRKRSPGA